MPVNQNLLILFFTVAGTTEAVGIEVVVLVVTMAVVAVLVVAEDSADELVVLNNHDLIEVADKSQHKFCIFLNLC